jgi:GT2 family glycosyltransferase/glycosyltransferase involved in cell wall biosynthesis
VTISVLLSGPRARVRDQLAALADASDVDVLVATDAPLDPPFPGVRVLSTDALGRHAAWQLAAERATGDVLLVMNQLAEPTPELITRLADAVRDGAALASPAISTASPTAYGYRATPDGALWPNTEAGRVPDALSLECLGSRPVVFASLPSWDVVAGHAELQLATHARTFGPLVVVPGAEMRRHSIGPSVSIIVCTQNRVDEIEACVLACLALDLDANDAELIVVDNGSTDDTAAVLAILAARAGDRVRIVHEPTLGLSRARNAGAAVARGEVLSFIDDDSRPAPGWLEHLRLVFCDPGVVIAGGPSCGLWAEGRPDGFPAATVAPYFSILDRGDAAHDSPRPEDGPWGNNWSARRTAVEKLGGFDVRFGAGEGGRLGGEEVLLSARAVAAELGRLRYDPGVTVGHRAPVERLTEQYVILRAFRCGIEDIRMRDVLGQEDAAAIDATAGIAAERLARFAIAGRRDAEAVLEAIGLADVPLASRIDGAGALGRLVAVASLRGAESVALGRTVVAIRPEHAGGRVRPSSAGPEVLVCFPDVPSPSRSAGHARALEMLWSLRRIGRRPVLFTLGSAGDEETLALLAAQGIEVHCADRGARLGDLATRGFATAFVSFWDIAERVVPALRSVSPGTRIVVDSVDLHYRRMARAAALGGDGAALAEAEAVRVRELAVYRSSDVVLAVSDEEQELLCELLPGTPVGILPTVHHPLHAAQSPAGRRGALFIGSYGHAPNVDAVRFLCDEVLPALRTLGCELPVAVAGSGMPVELADFARARGAEVLGFLPSVADELAHRRISIAPLRFGAGLKGKVGESLAAGVPVVGTSVAAEGFTAAHEAMLVADDAQGFAAAIARLAEDDVLWQRLSDGGRALIAGAFGPERCDRELADVLDYLDPIARAA